MNSNHETIKDDAIIDLFFIDVLSQDQLLTPHWHEHLELLALTRGSMTAWINDTSYEVSKGDVLVISPEDIHNTHTHADCEYHLLQIPPAHLKRISSDWEYIHFHEYIKASQNPSAVSSQCFELLQEMKFLRDEPKPGSQLMILSLLYRLLYLLYTGESEMISPERFTKNRRDYKRIQSSMDYVKDHFRQEITLSDAAAELGLTTEYFSRLFKKYTGQTFMTYVGQIRMIHFYQDLISMDDSINELMLQNGIRNYKVFSREFKKEYGKTPGQVRKENE